MPLVNCVRRDLRASAIGLIFLMFLGVPRAHSDESHPGLMAESLYAEAVIAYNRRQSDKALKILNELLVQNPRHLEALQLKALTLKGKGDDRQAIDTYTRLIQLQPEKERGPYYFELAVIYYRQKRTELAIPYFEKSIARKFNAGASHLFLGLSEFGLGKLNEAESHFEQVIGESDPEVRAVGYYYLGMINLKNGYGSLAMGDLVEARDWARSVEGSQMASDIAKSTQQLLSPFDKGQWFATFLFLPYFDSNVATSPIVGSASSTDQAVMTNISVGGGWVSSPMNKFQFVAGLRENLTGGPDITNPASSLNYSYWTNTASLYLNYKPLGRHSVGWKLDTNFRLQLSALPTPFSLGFETGPYYRFQATPRFQFLLEGLFRPSNYYTLSDYTGLDELLRVSVKYEGPNRFFNPGGNVYAEDNKTLGAVAEYLATGAGVYNTFRVNPKNTGVLSVDLSQFLYYRFNRTDGNLTFHASWVTQLSDHWSVLGDAAFIFNASSLASLYTYTRWTAGAGISWTL